MDFLKVVKTGEGLFPCKWHEHVQQWMANPHQAQMIIVRYEDLKKNTVNELQRICTFSGETREMAILERAVANASFAKMQKREIEFGWDNSAWPKGKLFIRRGKVGSYTEEMPVEVLTAFLLEARESLKKLGYPGE